MAYWELSIDKELAFCRVCQEVDLVSRPAVSADFEAFSGAEGCVVASAPTQHVVYG